MLSSAFSMRLASSAVRFPRVLTASISNESSTLSAAFMLIWVSPVAGLGSWPRKKPAFCA